MSRGPVSESSRTRILFRLPLRAVPACVADARGPFCFFCVAPLGRHMLASKAAIANGSATARRTACHALWAGQASAPSAFTANGDGGDRARQAIRMGLRACGHMRRQPLFNPAIPDFLRSHPRRRYERWLFFCLCVLPGDLQENLAKHICSELCTAAPRSVYTTSQQPLESQT